MLPGPSCLPPPTSALLSIFLLEDICQGGQVISHSFRPYMTTYPSVSSYILIILDKTLFANFTVFNVTLYNSLLES